MPKKRKPELLPMDVKLIQFSQDNPKPLFVSSKDVEKVVIGWSKKTASNLRSQKKGPRFFMVGGTPYYKLSDLEEFFSKCPVETINEI